MGANNRENCTEIDDSGAAVMIQSHVSTLILLGSTVYATRAATAVVSPHVWRREIHETDTSSSNSDYGARCAVRDVCAGHGPGGRRGDDRSPPARTLDISRGARCHEIWHHPGF